MTTFGATRFDCYPVDALSFSSYNYHYPVFKQQQLCDVINNFRQKNSPDVRRTCVGRMKMECQCLKNSVASDSIKGGQAGFQNRDKLPGPNGSVIPAKPLPDFLTHAGISPKESARWSCQTTPAVTSQARAEWNDFLNRCPERFSVQLPMELPGGEARPFYDGSYSLRYLRPDLTRGLGMEACSERWLGEIQGSASYSPYRSNRTTIL